MLLKIKELIDKYENIILSAHINPDGDALGSLLAFKYMINKYNKDKKVKIVIQDILPSYIYKFEEYKEIDNSYKNEDVELVIMLDTANIERAAIDKSIFPLASETINIDHHISNTKYLDINYVKDISSTSELIYKFLSIFDIELDFNIAKFMYLGIINDTGAFRHPNVTSSTFEVCSKLIETGINTSEITSILYAKSRNKAKIFGEAMSDFKFVEDISFAYYVISREYMEKNNITNDDTDGISELLMGIEGVNSSLFLREENGYYKGSLRSRRNDVNKVASLLGGGGHKLAAGFRSDKKSEEIIKIVEESLRDN